MEASAGAHCLVPSPALQHDRPARIRNLENPARLTAGTTQAGAESQKQRGYLRASTPMEQQKLFATALPPNVPAGMRYRSDFLMVAEQQSLLETIQSLPFRNSTYRQYTARRRTVNYGAGYDFQHQVRTPAPVIPAFLDEIRIRAAHWIGVEPDAFIQALISEYQPGTPLGWHRDVPDYESVVAISLLSPCRIRFRRYPWNPAERADIFTVEPQPGSAYLLSGDARWKWQHSVPAVKTLRYSITLRTARRSSAV
jgi:alkylated DNA repair dioxygenase AlkB